MDPDHSRDPIATFLDAATRRNTLGLVYGRRRIGKSTLLDALTEERGGFYWEATRGEPAIHLARLGEAVGAYLGAGRLAFENWHEALSRLVALGASGRMPIVLDEFGYLLEADPTLDSVIAAVLGPSAQRSQSGQARMILCGSAIALMRTLTGGEAPLRGRAGLELVMLPFDFRAAADRFVAGADLSLAARLYAVIGGVIGYATDMVDHDLPADLNDFTRWIAARVLSPAATLHHEATTLLAEDPTLSAMKPTLHHSILGAIANGAVAAGTISNRLRRPVSNLDPALKRLIAAGFVIRHEDPIRSQRPTYSLGDAFLQFHYAILEPHGSLLRERDPRTAWEDRLSSVFDARVRGPVFEEQARAWVRCYADTSTFGGAPDFVGPSTVMIDGREYHVDVVVAADEGAGSPAERPVLAIGEAKAGESVGRARLRQLESARAALGPRAAGARLLLFAPSFSRDIETEAARRGDVELIGLERLYHGQ